MEELLGEGSELAKKPPLDVTSRAFQPKKFVKKVLANISHNTFENKLVDEVGNAEQETGEALKQLIRDNLGTFIESKDAMDAVFTSDHELFTGEALEDVTAAFADAQFGCEGLVKPIMDFYKEVQHSRQSNEMLEKLFSVLSVPGYLYESCGVRVVLRKPSLYEARSSRRKAPTTRAAGRRGKAAAANRGEGGPHDEEDEELEDEDAIYDEDDDRDTDEEDGEERGRAAAAPDAGRTARGALEDIGGAGADGSGGASDLILNPGEELFVWYGTPLARWKDEGAQRHLEEAASNHEGAVLSLRRAMLYMEENYNLEDGTLVAAEDMEDDSAHDDGELRNGGGASLAATAAAQERKVSAVSRSPFTYKFSLALLRAALYLEDQLAEELVGANAADTVLIEDTISMMMDVSVATVKLWRFCTVLQTELRHRRHEHALDSLRDKLVEGAESAAAAAVGGGVDNRSLAEASDGDRAGAAGTGGGGSGSAPVRRYHPAQYFISSTRSIHARLTRASAGALLSEAVEWQRKVVLTSSAEAGPRRARDRAMREDEGTTTLSYGRGGVTYNASLQLSGAMLGNITDSFVGNSTFPNGGSGGDGSSEKNKGSGKVGDTAGEDVGSMSFAANNLRVTGFGDGLGSTKGGDGERGQQQQERQSSADDMEAYAASILTAFRTPEEAFDSFTTFSIGSMDMSELLEASCAQVRMHSKAMLQQLTDRSDTEATIMAEGALLNTFTARLSAACMANVEHVVVSYWGGIATTIHGGVFDFRPDPHSPLGRMINELTRGSGGGASVSAPSTPQQAPLQSPAPPASLASRPLPPAAAAAGGPVDDDEDGGGEEDSSAAGALGDGALNAAAGAGGSLEAIPEVRFIPVLPDSAGINTLTAAAGRSSTSLPATAASGAHSRPTLRDLSVQAVRRMIRSAGDIMRCLFLAFANRGVLSAFVRSVARYRVGDLFTHAGDERTELHAAILVEVLMGQWERMMTHVSDAVLRMKVAIGESCSTTTVSTNAQVEEAGGLLEELEQLRTACFHCYTHGVGMLSKAYITMLPMLPFCRSSAILEHRVRARLSRDFVSTSLPNKLLNLLSVVLDRTVPFLRRFPEVYDSADLFAAKAEDLAVESATESSAAAQAAGKGRRRVLRRQKDNSGGNGGAGGEVDSGRSGSGPSPSVNADPVTQFVASAHAKMVVEHLEEHEELLQALTSNLLLTFVDMLHAKSQRVSSGSAPLRTLEEREREVVECMADALCLPTTVGPLLLDHLLAPCVFKPLAAQHSTTADQVASMVEVKKAAFRQTYLSPVGEHCQLAVDAMASMYLAIPQQHIAKEVRERGFMSPMFDWQRLSGPAAATVRPYLSNCIVHIAKAHETLNWIHQPALGAGVTQRLVAHLATSFITAITADINAFEVSLDSSADFLVHGILLIEAEAMTVLEVVGSVIDSVAKSSNVGDVLSDLVLAREGLKSVTQAILQRDAAVYETLARAGAVGDTITGGGAASSSSGLPMTAKERREKREQMVSSARTSLRYMVAAICTHLEDSALDPGTTSFSHAVGGGVTASIADRLAKRKEGYEVRHASRQRHGAAAAEKRKKADDSAAAAGADAPHKSKTITRRKPSTSPVPVEPAPATPAEPAHLMPDLTEVLYGSLPTGQGASNAAGAARGGPRTVRRRRAAAADDGDGGAAAAAATGPSVTSAAPVSSVPAAAEQEAPLPLARPPPRRPRRAAAPETGDDNDGDGEGGAPVRRERRANRFKRSGAI